VKATYKLEGDGRLALSAYEPVNTILASIRVSYFPNVDAIARQLCPANPTVTSNGWHMLYSACNLALTTLHMFLPLL